MAKFIDSAKSFWKTIKSIHLVGWCLILTTMFMMVSIAFWVILPPRPQTLVQHSTTLLVADTVRHFRPDQIPTHNSNLINFLQANCARASSEIGVMENTKSQTRLFYVAIAAALITVLSGKNVTWNMLSVVGPMFLITLMYALEIHKDDANKRSFDCYTVEVRATEIVVNLHPNETTWYIKDGYLLVQRDSVLHKYSCSRKAMAFFHPTADQFTLFVVPFFIVFLIACLQTRTIWYKFTELKKIKLW